MSRDWMCQACQHLNFKKRDPCQQCSCPKYATVEEVSSYAAMQKTKLSVMAGDWYCNAMNCYGHNYASRPGCYRCGASKDCRGYAAAVMTSAGYANVTIPGWKTGDWICSSLECGMHNYASRMECFKCKAPKGYDQERCEEDEHYS